MSFFWKPTFQILYYSYPWSSYLWFIIVSFLIFLIRQDEVIAALAMSDGVVLLVDVVVGLTQYLGPCLGPIWGLGGRAPQDS